MKQAATNKKYAMLLIAFIIVVIAVYFASQFAFGLGKSTQTPSSTLTTTVSSSNSTLAAFRNNFSTAARVAFTASYSGSLTAAANESESGCVASIIRNLTSVRNPSTIDFFAINGSTCEYSSNGWESPINITNTTSSYCVNIANSEPSVFLNYNQSNSTKITANHIYFNGNSDYMSNCPAAFYFGRNSSEAPLNSCLTIDTCVQYGSCSMNCFCIFPYTAAPNWYKQLLYGGYASSVSVASFAVLFKAGSSANLSQTCK
jgi:hypothetical protein